MRLDVKGAIMSFEHPVSRRTFMRAVAAALSRVSIPSAPATSASAPAPPQENLDAQQAYDSLAKLGSNENPYGPSKAVLKAMQDVFKYVNRYGYPDGDIVQAIAEHHGVFPDNVLL